MNIRFDGKTVAVTGAGHGFGRCIAQTFAHLGARVFATDISAGELAETAAGGGIVTQVVDLRDRAAGAAWIRADRDADHGPIHVLVNNAGGVGGQGPKPLEDVSDEDWNVLFDINVNAAFTLCRAAAPAMKRAGGGRIVNTSSGAGLQAVADRHPGLLQRQARGGRADAPARARVRAVQHHRQFGRARLHPHQCGDREAVGELRRRTGRRRWWSGSR